MKMTFQLWRTTSVWLCVAVLFVCLSSHVGCTEPLKEAESPENPQDAHVEDGPGQMTHNVNEKLESTQVFFDNEHSKDDEEQQNKEKSLGGEVPAVEPLVGEDLQQDVPDQNFKNDQGTLSDPQTSEQCSSLVTEFHDGRHFQEEIPEGISNQEPDLADINHSDPVDCEVEPNPFDSDSSPPVVLENTSNAHTTGTKIIPDPPVSSPAPSNAQHREANASHMLKAQDQDSSAISEAESSLGSKDPEDIPTFDEWKRKVMEVEKEKSEAVPTHAATSGAAHPVKKAQKNFNNYASVECGAKILGANPEAKSTSSILKESMDLYMLNPCSNKIWFIIELCEPIQVKQLDIANFELFSSTPKEFLVSISNRYPTNKWLKLGTFHARDERTVQTFPLDEHHYAKYVKMFTKYLKVELLSHFGSEHFCPLSLIRVFGTSMVEEYEEIADPHERLDEQDDDMDYPGHAPTDGDSKNLIGSAKDAIFNIVKDIAVVLGGSDDKPGNETSLEANMTESPEQLETATGTSQTDIHSEPEVEDKPELAATEMETSPSSDSNVDDLALAEEQIVTRLEADEDEPSISSIITHLGKEDDVVEDLFDQQQPGSPERCALFPRSPACTCAASLNEYLLQQCFLHLPKNCTLCQTQEKMLEDAPNWVIYQPPSYPPPQQPRMEAPERGTLVSESEGQAHSANEPQLSEKETESEPSPTEPSANIKTSESSFDKEVPVVEIPQFEPEVPDNVPVLESNLDSVLDQEIQPTETFSKPLDATPTVPPNLEDGVLSQERTNEEQSLVIKNEEVRDPHSVVHPKPAISEPEPTLSPEENALPQTEAIPDPLQSEVGVIDSKIEDLADDIAASTGTPLSPPAPTPSDIYAELHNGTEQNGSPVHGSSQKESVFMRLNNRIKALEMNMSLSGRYLEQLSQRYRKQMEEMQKAFNKTIIKLQNTSRVAEEQDLRQTESIQQLQGQLENVTQLVLNLSVQVIQLQSEVSDRESYLLLSLFLCLFLGLLLYINRCRMSSSECPESESPSAESYTYCCPERQFSRDEAALKRSASYPLIHSESFQFASTMGPEILQHEETQSLGPVSKKRRRRKVKSLDKVETLKPSFQAAEPLQNKAPVFCNGASVLTEPPPLTQRFLDPPFRDSPSEGSSEGSSHSDDPSFCGITAACNSICDGLPLKSHSERRALRRRRPRPGSVVDYLKAPSRHKRNSLPIYTIHDIMERQEQSSYGVSVPLSGPM